MFIHTLIKSKLFRQFVQYLLVGGAAFVIDFSTLYLLTSHAGMHYLASATVGFLLGLLTNYVLCIWWIFDFRAVENRLHEFVIFAVIGGAGLVLNNLLLFGLTEWAGTHYLLSKVVAAALILIFNFSLRRVMLFTDRKRACAHRESASQPS